jgi:hypothetical protein
MLRTTFVMLRRVFPMLRTIVLATFNEGCCDQCCEFVCGMLRAAGCATSGFRKHKAHERYSSPAAALARRGGRAPARKAPQTFDPAVRSGYGAYPPGDRVPPIRWSLLRPPWSHCWTDCWKKSFRSGDDVHHCPPNFVKRLPWGLYDDCALQHGANASDVVSGAGWIRHTQHTPPSMFLQ